MLLACSNAIPAILAIAIQGLAARGLDFAAFADWRRVAIVFAISSPIITAGLQTAILHLISANPRESGQVSTTAFLLSFGLWSAIAVMVGFVFPEQISRLLGAEDLTPELRLFSLVALAQAAGSLTYSTFVALKMTRWAMVTTAAPAVAVLAMVLWADPSTTQELIYLTAIGWSVPTTIVMLRALALSAKPTRAISHSLLKVGIPLAFSTGAGRVYQQSDKAVVSSQVSSQEFAVYSNGAFEIPLMAVLTSTIGNILQRDFSSLLRSGHGTKEALALQHRSALATATLLFPAWFFLELFATDLVVLVFGDRFTDSANILRIYLLILPSRAVMWGNLLIASDRSGLVLRVTIANLVANLLLTILALQFFGVLAAAATTVFTHYTVGIAGRIVATCNVLSISVAELLPWRSLGKVALQSLVLSVPVGLFTLISAQYDLPGFISLTAGAAIQGVLVLYVAIPILRPLTEVR